MRKIAVDKILKVGTAFFLLMNLILLARILGIIYLPGEMTALEKARQGAQSVIAYSEDLARSYEVGQQKPVKDILAKFKYEVEKADGSGEVASLMVDYGRQVQDIIFREVQNKRIVQILNIVNSQQLPEEGNMTISNIEGQIKFVDPRKILTEETREKLKELTFNQTIELEVKNKSARLLTAGGIFNQVDYLQTKVASLERQLKVLKQKSGYEILTGQGIIINVYDKQENLENTGIVHDSDIRDIINELLIAGALGIEVGGQRLAATSPIRCVGPTILVNNKPIPVNPVIIKAVGEPEVLKSSLDIIKKQLQAFGIELDIEQNDEISLSKL